MSLRFIGKQPGLIHRLGSIQLGWMLVLWFISYRDALSNERFEFREPRHLSYQVASLSPLRQTPLVQMTSLSQSGAEDGGIAALGIVDVANQWLEAVDENNPDRHVRLGDRVVLQTAPGVALDSLIQGHPLCLLQTVHEGLFVLMAGDVWTALDEAQRLAVLPGVVAAHPVMQRQLKRHSLLPAKPNDPYYDQQWHLENRNLISGLPLGVDINARSAWTFTHGTNILVAVVDDGIQLSHPDLKDRIASGLNYNWFNLNMNGNPMGANSMHGTAVAGLIAATANNGIGVSGVSPESQLVSWVVFDDNDYMPDDQQMMSMFQYQSNNVAVQNHSWGNGSAPQWAPSVLEASGISNAVHHGRGGLGNIIVRAAGNGRLDLHNANDDGYLTDPGVIAVAAVRFDGQMASYSNPGANILVAAPSGDPDEDQPNLFTTDITGSGGYNQKSYTNDLANYAFGDTGFDGTSASTPLITGIAALVLSVNTNLTYRDVQQVLILASHQTGPVDSDVVTNGAGFLVGHNAGFGVPDSRVAVDLAMRWTNRPPVTNVVYTSEETQAIPDNGFQLFVDGVDAPLSTPAFLPSHGPHAEKTIGPFPVVDVGRAATNISTNLTGCVALIQRGENYFYEKIDNAAKAGAAMAIIYNNANRTDLNQMGATEMTTIPAVFIGQNDGDSLSSLLASGSNILAGIKVQSVDYSFQVTNDLCLEQVQVRIKTTHQYRGDLRIVLTSPSGVESVLQNANSDSSAGPEDWTYMSTHHFYESSFGTWNVRFIDEYENNTGDATYVSLILNGVAIEDSDHDGLDDTWEKQWIGDLAHGPKEDLNGDGINLMREYVLGLNPLAAHDLLRVSVERRSSEYLRLSWPGGPAAVYDISGSSMTVPFQSITNFQGVFGEMEWFVPLTNQVHQFFRIQQKPQF